MKTRKITLKQFAAYESVRASGVTNMWAVQDVADLSGGELTKDDVLYIISNYSEIHAMYPNVRATSSRHDMPEK